MRVACDPKALAASNIKRLRYKKRESAREIWWGVDRDVNALFIRNRQDVQIKADKNDIHKHIQQPRIKSVEKQVRLRDREVPPICFELPQFDCRQ